MNHSKLLPTWTLVKDHQRVSISIELADSWWSRFKGLMMRKSLPNGQGLYLQKTNSIHMCFMRFSIDAIYFDHRGKVVKIVEHLSPWTGISVSLKGRDCLEMKAGEAKRLGIVLGMKWLERT